MNAEFPALLLAKMQTLTMVGFRPSVGASTGYSRNGNNFSKIV
jgi:hypothetical protein